MKAIIVNIQRFSLHDGPGIRTLVFFKGCPLNCRWCANPECISPAPQLGFSKLLCNRCGNCFSACPPGAILAGREGLPEIDRERCTVCGRCVEVCPEKALTIYGREVALEELFEEVCRDRSFYRHSGGGVTVSGGEATLQADYVTALFKLCREAGIETAVETCGCVNPVKFRKVLELTDFVLYDLKLLDDRRHRELTGRSNAPILRNARLVVDRGVPVQFRMPLVPGLNDDPENIKATAGFLQRLNADACRSIELIPYHRLGVGKYEAIGREYPLLGLESAGPEEIELARKRFEEQGITCLVSS
jgi:pyruvate formate lyase activating enzyme